MGYLPIENHGVIGDLHTAALVGTDGTVDWLCLPAFDSASVFCSILDDEKGGHFELKPESYGRSQQLYLPETNVLLTRFLSPEGLPRFWTSCRYITATALATAWCVTFGPSGAG